MAVLAIGAAGAAIGAGAAWGAGAIALSTYVTAAGLGFSIASMAGNMLFPGGGSTTVGSRLGDLTVSSSAYGAVRNIVYGRARVNGNVIWALPIREEKTTTHKGGKGGGPKQTAINYTYFGTFALALCEGPVDQVLRIWADATLVYDATSGTDTVRRPGLNFRFYPGDEAQLPDSIIEANEGVGQVPAFRGTCYLLFDDIPLVDYGNRIPSITAEVSVVSSDTHQHLDLTTFPTGFAFGTVDWNQVAVDSIRGVAYFAGIASDRINGPHGLIRVNLQSMAQDRQALSTDITLAGVDEGLANLLVIPDGTIFATLLAGLPRFWARIDGPTLKQTHSADAWAIHHFAAEAGGMTYIEVDTPFGTHYYIVAGGQFSEIAVLSSRDLSPILSGTSAPDGSSVFGLCRGRSTATFGEAWAVTGTYAIASDPIYVCRISVSDVYSQDLLGATEHISANLATVGTIHATDIDPAAPAGFWGSATSTPIYDDTDDSIIFVVNIASAFPAPGQNWAIKWCEGAIVWKTPVPVGNPGSSASIIGGTVYQLMSGLEIVQLDAATGTKLYDAVWPAYSTFEFYRNGGMISDGPAAQMLVHTSAHGWTKLYVNRPTGSPVVVGDVLADLCLRSGMSVGDFDATDITQAIEGFVVSQQSTAASIAQNLANIFLLNCVERDFKLFWENRGKGVQATITQSELIRLNPTDAEPWKETRKQDPDLPFRVTLTVMDLARDYQTNTQSAQRAKHPDPTMFSANQTDLQLTAVMNADQAKQQAEKLLYTAWLNRRSFQIRLAGSYIWLDAGDSIDIVLDSGETIQGRLGNADIGVDYALDTTLFTEDYGTYASSATGSTGAGFTPQIVAAVPFSALLLLDTPLLRDTDETSLALRAYWGAAPYQEVPWRGAELDQSADGQVWTALDTSVSEATWGHILTPPADPGSCFHTQIAGTMTVLMSVGGAGLASITDSALANGYNSAIVLKANGEVEVLQFRDVTALGHGEYELSFLNRGRRGTDTMAHGLAGGDVIVMLSSATIDPLQLPLSYRNVPLSYRAPSLGQMPEAAVVLPFAFSGRDKMPYAPVHVTAALSGSDIDLAWVRRTRVGGDMLPGTGTVPLAEQSEAYEVDILAAPGGSVKRTLTGLSTPAATYTAAEIAADFGTMPANLSVLVYQISAIVGRGFAREYLVEIA